MPNKRQAEDRPGDLLTVKDAARYKKVHRSTVYKAITEGRLQPFRPDPPYLISRAALDAWIVTPKKRRPGHP